MTPGINRKMQILPATGAHHSNEATYKADPAKFNKG